MAIYFNRGELTEDCCGEPMFNVKLSDGTRALVCYECERVRFIVPLADALRSRTSSTGPR